MDAQIPRYMPKQMRTQRKDNNMEALQCRDGGLGVSGQEYLRSPESKVALLNTGDYEDVGDHSYRYTVTPEAALLCLV